MKRYYVCLLALALAVLPAAAALATTAKPLPSVRKACMPDVHKFCSGIPLLSDRLRQCMKAHGDDLSDACKAAEAAREAARRSNSTSS